MIAYMCASPWPCHTWHDLDVGRPELGGSLDGWNPLAASRSEWLEETSPMENSLI